VEFAGAVYHVTARSNERKAIFHGQKDHKQFLEVLAEAELRFGWRLHAYCLMPNHYHLVVSTPRANLSRAMGWLQTTYTARFNARHRHRRRGPLFAGRYKAQLVQADEYGRWLVEYVHLNPVRPRQKGGVIAVERRAELRRYPWSSHLDYGGYRRNPPRWLCLDWLAYWGGSRRQARGRYRQAIRRAFGQASSDPWRQLRGGLVLGGEKLCRKVRALTRGKGGLERARWRRTEEAGAMRAKVLGLLEGETDERVKLWARIRLGGERGVEVGREYGYADGSGVTQVLKRLEARAARNRSLAKRLEQLTKLSRVNG
jgi:REP element-mobilizing transposase RayT